MKSIYDTSSEDLAPSNLSPLNTMVANSMGRGNKDSSFREQISDITDGAMGTHLGNNQSLTSEAISDYNQNNQTDIQKNMNIIDATRGYGQMASDNTAESVIESRNESSSHHFDGNSAESDVGNNPFSSSSNPVGPSIDMAMQQNVKATPYALNVSLSSRSMEMMGMEQSIKQPHDLSPSDHLSFIPIATIDPDKMKTGPVYAAGTPVNVDKATRVINKPVVKKVYINQSLNRDIKTQDSDEIQITPNIRKTTDTAFVSFKDEDEDDEDGIKKIGIEKSEGPTFIRPIVVPSGVEQKVNQSKSKEHQIRDRFSLLPDDDFLSIIKEVTLESKSDDLKTKITAECKLMILKKETDRRLRLTQDVNC